MIPAIRHWLHRAAHALGWQHGIVTVWSEGSRVMVGFRCNTCGRVDGTHPALFTAEQEVGRE